MLRVVVPVLLVALAVTGSAPAGRFDPHRNIRPGDESRARAMLVRHADLGAGFRRQPDGALVTMPITCRALDESDLTLTGEAGSYLWLQGTTFVFAATRVYASTADANASWRRQTSRAGRKCAATATKSQLGGGSAALVPFAFPRLAPRTVAYRLTVKSPGATAYEDVVALQRSRGRAARALEVRLARIVAARQAEAMRGS